jgi:hypothetical protein
MKIFMSYRRADTGAAAGRVYDRLCRLLAKSDIFFDVSTIGGGEDFEKRIETAIGGSNVALIFIGDKWLEPVQATGNVRICEPNDYVHAEVRDALARPMLVLPILVGGAQMPKSDRLPEDVRDITTKNALPLRHESFDDDTENIVAAVFGKSAKERAWEDKGSFWIKLAYASCGAVAASAVMTIVALLHHWILGRPLSASIGGLLTTLILIAALLLGGWVGLKYEARTRQLR